MRVGLALALLLALGARAEAACSGSGITWTCDTSTTVANINTALSSATDGATLTFDAGSYTWTGGTNGVTLVSTKAVRLTCASNRACTVTWTGNAFKLPNATTSKRYEIDGFVWTNTGNGNFVVDCPGGTCADTFISGLHIHDNDFNYTHASQSGALVLINDLDTNHDLQGLFADNDVDITFMQTMPFYFASQAAISTRPLCLGASTNFFIEDNDFDITEYVESGIGLTDGWATFCVVVRFNTIHNARVLTHGTRHGYGWDNLEVYGNIFNVDAGAPTDLDDCYRAVHHQGSGSYMVWANRFTCSAGYDPDMIVVQHYRSFEPNGAPDCDGNNGIDGNRSPEATYRGWPCFHQPGRPYNGGTHLGSLYPVRAWLNTRSDTNAMISLVVNGSGNVPNYTNNVLVSNRDYYNAVSKDAQTTSSNPFNGTTGMGHGTAARKPSTCTETAHASDAGYGGVGYWATDEGDWNTSTGNPKGVDFNGADGVLYECIDTDQWTTRYGANATGEPFEYPHPWQTGGSLPPEFGIRPPFLIKPGE